MIEITGLAPLAPIAPAVPKNILRNSGTSINYLHKCKRIVLKAEGDSVKEDRIHEPPSGLCTHGREIDVEFVIELAIEVRDPLCHTLEG